MWAWTPTFLHRAMAARGTQGSFLGAVAVAVAVAVAATLHLSGFVASISTGPASDRWGRRPVLIAMASAGALCSLAYGWMGTVPLWMLFAGHRAARAVASA